MWIIRNRILFFILGIIFVGVSIGLVATRGFSYGVEFTGGSSISLSVVPPVDIATVSVIATSVSPDAQTQKQGDSLYLIRTGSAVETMPAQLAARISDQTGSAVSLQQVSAIGPSVGSELRSKALWALIVVALGIILFIAYTFRSVSKPVSSWAYGVVAVAVLVHDIMIPAGFFAITGRAIDPLFVVGLLTVLGVSVNDTIVVFDRIREHLARNQENKIEEPFEEVVGQSLRDTMTRSIMTSLTVLLVLVALVVWGPASTQNLSIVMLLGMFFGTYSSIFLASPLLVVWNNIQTKREAAKV
jgi:preprotein translocase subunit SecF